MTYIPRQWIAVGHGSSPQVGLLKGEGLAVVKAPYIVNAAFARSLVPMLLFRLSGLAFKLRCAFASHREVLWLSC